MNAKNEPQLMQDWESVFRQGLLTFWVLTALKDTKMSVEEIGKEIRKLTKESYQPAEQTLYRVLRKYHDNQLVSFSEIANTAGPKKKLYELTDVGERMLIEFTKKNIELFQIDKVKKIINEL